MSDDEVLQKLDRILENLREAQVTIREKPTKEEVLEYIARALATYSMALVLLVLFAILVFA